MSSHSLAHRLQVLIESYKQTINLIQELQKFPATTSSNVSPSDEQRLELSTEIHDNLKELEDTLELLRQEVDDGSHTGSRRWTSSNHDDERERNAATITRLTEDLKSARAAFRRAQLQAKRNVDAAKRKEREQLFADRIVDHGAPRRKGQEKLTQDEIALNAAQDVTRALRRTHDLLQGNLQQSQFAQQTLDESQDALKGLGESYGGTGDLLKNSRGLAKQLVASNKSDTWYLTSAFYMLAITIAWLVFRRWIYGPAWWLLWQPLKLMWWVTLTSLGSIGFGKAGDTAVSVQSSARISSTPLNVPKNPSGMVFRSMELPNKGGGWGQPYAPPKLEEDSMIERIGRAMGDSANTDRKVDELKDEGGKEQPRNPKKRMMELEKEQEYLRDEL